MVESRHWARIGLAATVAVWVLGVCGVTGAGAARTATPSFRAPDCPGQLRAGASLTSSLLSDATHTMKRYEAGGDTNGAEISCNYYDPAKNYNYEWTLYYLFKTDAAAHVAQEIAGGYGPLGGWAHPDPSYCGVSKATYAYVECSPSSDADTLAGAKAMLAQAESLAAPQASASAATTTTTALKPHPMPAAALLVPISSVSNGCGGGSWDTVVAAQNYVGNTSKFADSNVNPLARSYPVNFKDACDLHDACYSGAVVRDKLNGGSIADFRNFSRAACDTKFLADMRWQCTRQIPGTSRTALANCQSTGGNVSIGAKSRFNFVRCWGNLFYETAASASGADAAARINDKVSTLSAYCLGLRRSK